MTPAEALAVLRASRDDEHDARIWAPGATVTRLAQAAGVRVEYVRVDLRALTCERRTVEPEEEGA